MPRTLLFSIRPHFASAILRGEKTVELRRVRVATSPGDFVLIYASAPTMALIGTAEVSTTAAKSPPLLWQEVNASAGITAGDYESYFRGAGIACAIGICRVVALKKPVSLEELRQRWPGFQPPQSYRFLSKLEREQLLPTSEHRTRTLSVSVPT